MDKAHLTGRNGIRITVSTKKATLNKFLLNKLLRYCGVEGGKVVRHPQVKQY